MIASEAQPNPNASHESDNQEIYNAAFKELQVHFTEFEHLVSQLLAVIKQVIPQSEMSIDLQQIVVKLEEQAERLATEPDAEWIAEKQQLKQNNDKLVKDLRELRQKHNKLIEIAKSQE